MKKTDYDALKLENQLCFPLYACSKGIIRRYTPYLEEIDLTYTQYITMMVLWEHKILNVKALGERLHLDSGTLTPMLKKLEAKKFITRLRNKNDERNLVISITDEGEALKEKAIHIPEQMKDCINLDEQDIRELFRILNKLMDDV